MGVEVAIVGIDRHHPHRQTACDHGRQPGQAGGEGRIGRVGDGGVVVRLAVGGDEGGELGAQLARGAGHGAGAGQLYLARGGGQRAEPADRAEHGRADRIPYARARERVGLRALQRGDRVAGAGQGGGEAVGERQALERVVGGARGVQVAPEPTQLVLRVELSHLPVGEVRLVGMVVADGREHRHLALVVELGQAPRGRVPHQARVLAQRGTGVGRHLQGRSQAGVLRVAHGGQERHRVHATGHEDRDQERPRIAGRGLGDSLLEGAQAHARGAVDREGQARGPPQEGAPPHAGAGRGGHARLHPGQAPPGLGHGGLERPRAREVRAASGAHQDT